MKIHLAKCLLPISHDPIAEGALAVENGKIAALGPREEILGRYPGAETIDHGAQALMPGLVNAHTQLDILNSEIDWKSDAFVTSLLGLLETKRNLSSEARQEAVQRGLKASLRAGTTTVGDAGAYFELKDLSSTLPLRWATYSEILLSSEADIQKNFESALTFVEDLEAVANARRSGGIAPFAPYILSRHLLKVLSQHSHESSIPLKIRAAESFAEMQFFYDATGEMMDILFSHLGWKDQKPPVHRKTPVEYLSSIGFLENAPALIGCLHLSEEDLRLIYASGSTVIHCPRANKRMKLGEAPVRKMLDKGIPVALGTDFTWNRESVSLWDEMRTAAKMHPSVSASEILRMATLSGAKALHLDKRIGSLEVGKQADCLMLSCPPQTALEDIPAALIRNTEEKYIKTILIDGQPLKDLSL